MDKATKNIVFVDGYCMVCHWLVLFVAKRDKQDLFRFAAIQDHQAEDLEGVNKEYLDKISTVILKSVDGQVYYHSDAVIQIISSLPGIWSSLKFLLIIPKFLRDPIYRLFARIRYVFGRKDSCTIPTKEIKDLIKKGPEN